MPINLDRAEKIGNDFNKQSPIKLDPNFKFADIEVLTIHKIPINKLSFIKDDHYECPICGDSSLKMILDYRCTKCRSKVIKWKCYADAKEEKHIYYDGYIKRFYEAVELQLDRARKRKEKELLESENG